MSTIDGDDWVNLDEKLLWKGAESGMSGLGHSSAQELVDLKFGFPNLATLINGHIFV